VGSGVLAEWVKGRPFSVLCGAGISADSGLPTATGLHAVVRAHFADDAGALLEPYLTRRDEIPVLRFEGILDAMQRLLDPDLTVLAGYRLGEAGPAHEALAMLATKVPVVTTNIDGLVERAAQRARLELTVRFREDDFRVDPEPGLYKIHGSLSRFDEHGEHELAMHEDGAPVVTLTVISATRESAGRRKLIEALLRDTVVIVVGYSSSDDFDVSRWLRTAERPTHVVWIQFAAGANDRVLGPSTESVELDAGLRRLLADWRARGLEDCITVILSSDPARLLCDLAEIVRRRFERIPPAALSSGTPSPWAQYVLSGALLAQMSHYLRAIPLFATAVALAPDSIGKLKSLLELADAECWSGNERFDDAILHASEARDLSSAAGAEAELFAARAGIIELNARRLGQPAARAAVADDLRAVHARFVDDPRPALRAVAFDALVNLAQAQRHLGGTLPELEQRLEGSGLLQPKAQRHHERAVQLWRSATSLDELGSAIREMHEAIDFRADVGDIPGLAASWNVLGGIYLRWAWLAAFEDEALLGRARDAIERSHSFAARHELRFAVAQAELNRAVLHVRANESARASESVARLVAMHSERALDARTAIQVEFCKVLVDVTADSSQGALERAGVAYDGIEAKGASSNDALIQRVGRAAAANAAACHAWARGGVAPRPDAAFLRPQLAAFLDRRRSAFESRLEEALPLGRLLFDPLG
jgi:tetratricopeptide (TPR) repeat protein